MLAKEVGQRGSEGFECDDGIEIFSDSELEEIPQKVISRSIRALEDTLQIFNQAFPIEIIHAFAALPFITHLKYSSITTIHKHIMDILWQILKWCI